MLGDFVESALSRIGITKDRVEAWLGEECNCEERKQKLNQLHLWARRVVYFGKTDKAEEYLDQIIEGDSYLQKTKVESRTQEKPPKPLPKLKATSPRNPRAVFLPKTELETRKSARIKPEAEKRSISHLPPDTHPRFPKIRWQYGVTTVLSRAKTLLPPTLDSLEKAGFSKPWLFIDDCPHSDVNKHYASLLSKVSGVSNSYPKLGIVGNWILALWELYIREPQACLYAIFQDDISCCRNLREYLSWLKYPKNGYLNLYTFPKNQKLAKQGQLGLFRASQNGLGALALVFSREVVQKLLASDHTVGKPTAARNRGKKTVDGMIVTALNKAKVFEYCHNPSLVQHTGRLASSSGNPIHPLAPSFPGSDFDCLTLLPSKAKDEHTNNPTSDPSSS